MVFGEVFFGDRLRRSYSRKEIIRITVMTKGRRKLLAVN